MSSKPVFSVAPMIEWTDQHCRYFHRQLSRHAVLYTEMVTSGAIIFGRGDYLAYNDSEHPVALQLGGSDPQDLARCTALAVERGYDEINLNVGCPSDRVQKGRFGACLMAEPQLVQDCLAAMQEVAGDIPVTIKTRLGIDEHDSYDFLCQLLDTLPAAGVNTVILHARKAWLQGLSPKQNRDIPPLNYPRVYQVKRDFPALNVHLNGGIQNLDECRQHLQHVDGVMLGRAAYQNPWMLSQVDPQIYGMAPKVDEAADVLPIMARYIENHIDRGGKFWHVARHMLGLFQNCPGARQWRRHLSDNGPRADSVSPLWEAADMVLSKRADTA